MSTGNKTTLILQGAALWSALQDMSYQPTEERRRAYYEFDAWAYRNPSLREAAKRLQFETFDKVNAADFNAAGPVRYVVVYGLATDQERDETRALESYADALKIVNNRPHDHRPRVSIAQDIGTGIGVRRTFDYERPSS